MNGMPVKEIAVNLLQEEKKERERIWSWEEQRHLNLESDSLFTTNKDLCAHMSV